MRTILVVDDEPDSLDTTIRILNTENEGNNVRYNIIDADSAQKALLRISQAKNAPVLAIIDLRLEHKDDPNDISGLELITRQTFPTRIPVIILSANDKMEPLQRVLNSSSRGRIKYLQKSQAAIALVPMIESSLASATKKFVLQWAAWALLALSLIPLFFMVLKLWNDNFLQGVVSNLLVNVMWLSGGLLLRWTRDRF